MAYSKSSFAKQLGISSKELEKRARDAGYGTTEEYYMATGGSGKTPQDVINDIFKVQEEQIKKETSFVNQYLTTNPFAFDEALATQSATAEFEPYYSEALNDYLADIETKRVSVEDDKRLSTILNDYNVAQTTRSYARAEEQARQGFAGSGMFFSGAKERTMGELGIEKEETMGSQAAKYGNEQRDYGTSLDILDTSAQRQTRDIGREKEVAIAGGIEQRRGESQKAYYNPLVQSYYRQFPTSSGSALAGYVPEEFLRY
jgi:hypothetical protein